MDLVDFSEVWTRGTLSGFRGFGASGTGLPEEAPTAPGLKVVH